MSRRQLIVAVSLAALVVLLSAIVAVALSGGSQKASLVTPSSSPTKTAAPTKTARPEPTPTITPVPTHFPIATHTPSSLFPKSHVSTSACRVSSGTQPILGRTVIVDLPARLPAPVIFDYHAGHRDAAQEHGYTGLGPAGANAGFIVVTPDGTSGRWNFPTTEALPDDVSYTQGVAAMLAFAGCSNGKLYSAGMSDGADMAVTAGCRIAQVRAVFAVAPSITPRGACTRKAFTEVHGTADPIVPYSGSAAGSFADTPSEPVASRLPFWTNGCAGPIQGSSPAAGTTVQVWNCGAGRTVALDTVSGGGHTWPGAVGNAPVSGLGAQAPWSADAAALAFFAAH